jgi:hypothetical protein
MVMLSLSHSPSQFSLFPIPYSANLLYILSLIVVISFNTSLYNTIPVNKSSLSLLLPCSYTRHSPVVFITELFGFG